jgi:hypothetical protein
MPTLRELQCSFAAALYEGRDAPLCAQVRAQSAEARELIGIYRHQLHEGFRRALAVEFPVTARLVGRAYFARLAREFQCAHPSRAGDLHHIGAPFAAFLTRRCGGGSYDYLAHVARLEWAVQECARAPQAPPFDARILQSIPPRRCAELHFELHPACRLVVSPYPALAIWRANQHEPAAPEIIDLRGGPTRILVRRDGSGVAFHELGAAEFALLEKIAQDCCLGAALDAAQQEEANFDPGPTLRRIGALGALSGARLDAR